MDMFLFCFHSRHCITLAFLNTPVHTGGMLVRIGVPLRIYITNTAENKTVPQGGRVAATQTVASGNGGDFLIEFVRTTGHWRSWLARFHGMEEVIGSNPICSTTFSGL
jgi:hypothetical protein